MHGAYKSKPGVPDVNGPYTANLLGALALAVTDHVTEALESDLAEGGNASAAILSIGTRPGESIESLAKVLGLSHSATVRTVDRLERRGWVGRAPSGIDTRATALSLTRSGRAKAKKLIRERDRILTGVTSHLTTGELTTLTGLLTKMLSQLPATRADARHLCRLCNHGPCHDIHCPVGTSVPDPA